MAAERAWRNFSLLYGNARGSGAGNRHGVSCFVFVQRDVSEDGAAAGSGGGVAARQDADGNGFAVPAAAGAAREAERAGERGRGSANAGECEKLGARRSGACNGGEFSAVFRA